MKKKIVICLYVALIGALSFYIVIKNQEEVNLANRLKEEKSIFEEIKKNYNQHVLITRDSKLYKKQDNQYVESIEVSKDLYLELEDKTIKDYNDQYFKIQDMDYYVYYKNATKSEKKELYDRYKRFIPWNKSVKVLNNSKIYYDDNTYITIEKSDKAYPLIIKESDKYYVEYNNRLGYLNVNSDIELIDEVNSTEQTAPNVAVIAYHYTYNKEDGENCTNGIICHEQKQVESHLQYIKENNFFTSTMDEFEKYMDGKIQLPKKSVVITFDDGWWVHRMTILLNDYKLNGTLFLIGKLGSYEQWRSEYVEVHSHTYDLHDIGICPGGQGAPIKCLSREKILEDLAKSREQLHGSTVFCWPFYEYNDYSIGLVKEAGFTMAFRGGMTKAIPGTNKYLIPRYTIHNTTTVAGLASYIG